MSILDFKEIPQANQATGKQDEFELFSRDFLEYLGYRIVTEPSRGQDGGMDLLVEEERVGISRNTRIRWLVSCKHYAHSGRSIGVDDELNIPMRVKANKCNGFIGFYSTLASTGLTKELESWSEEDVKELQIFHRGSIESSLLKKPEGIVIAKRYFPKSMDKWFENGNSNSSATIELSETRRKYYEEYIQRKRAEKS